MERGSGVTGSEVVGGRWETGYCRLRSYVTRRVA